MNTAALLDNPAGAGQAGPMTPEEMRETLAELGWSQAELARRLSDDGGEAVAGTTVWRYLAGKRKVPAGLAAYLRLARRVKSRGIKL